MTGITVTNAGSGYSASNLPTIACPGGGSGLVSTVTLGAVTGLTVTAPGSGYSAAALPVMTCAGGSGLVSAAILGVGEPSTIQVQRGTTWDIASGVLASVPSDDTAKRTSFSLSAAGVTGATMLPFAYVGWDIMIKTQSNPEEFAKIVLYPGDLSVVIDTPLQTAPRAGVTNFAVKSTSKWVNATHQSGAKVYAILTGAIPGERTALRVYAPRFAAPVMGQSNPYPAALNTLSITFAPNIDIQSQ